MAIPSAGLIVLLVVILIMTMVLCDLRLFTRFLSQPLKVSLIGTIWGAPFLTWALKNEGMELRSPAPDQLPMNCLYGSAMGNDRRSSHQAC